MGTKADLQVHSRFSRRPPEWILRRLGVPESFSEPEFLYDSLIKAGMDFVTITDRNSIEGCLKLIGKPGFFISQEITAYFPDGVKTHLLAWNITPAQHEQIQKLRRDIFKLVEWMQGQNIVHGVSHPFFTADRRFSIDHFEKIVLLCTVFEGLNGQCDKLVNETLVQCLSALTPQKIEELERKHGFKALCKEPWKKSFFGSSDDYSSLHIARCYTKVPHGGSVEEFLNELVKGTALMEGESGSALSFSHRLYATVYYFFQHTIAKSPGLKAASASTLVSNMLSKFLAGKNPTSFSFQEKMGFGVEWFAQTITGKGQSLQTITMARELAEIFEEKKFQKILEEELSVETSLPRKSFITATHLTNRLAYVFFNKFVQRVGEGKLLESWQAVTAMAPLFLMVFPYVKGFYEVHKDRHLLGEAAKRFLGSVPESLQNTKRAWFTDTIEDVNGVATTIRTMVQQAQIQNKDLQVVTSRASLAFSDIPIKNFAPVGEFEIPEYELQKLSFPPLLNIVEYCEREKFSELIISTPGPVGVSALLAAKLLGLKTVAIYHTDFPQYVKILIDDDMLETLCWKYMFWFYQQMDLVYVNSQYYMDLWVERGIPANKIKILPRGIDTESFNPNRNDRQFWNTYGLKGDEIIFLYVGRVSKEKNIDVVMEAFERVEPNFPNAKMVVVGDGPYLKELKHKYPEVTFTGYLRGNPLWTAYASADVFVFPSTTDTFGNVVLEAHAAGLPTIVSDTGGPRELVVEGETGYVTRSMDPVSFAEAMEKFLTGVGKLEEMKRQCRRSVEDRTWSRAFSRFWDETL
ncbi:MAG: glycosyltransferase [Verrucomicrobiota bacterium]|nr:glycosyltransferase [Verrucomicrobiota bacterium]